MFDAVNILDKQITQSMPVSISLGDVTDALIRSAGTGIYMLQDGVFLYTNHLFQELTGYTNEELLSTNPLNLVHPDDRELVRMKAIANLKKAEDDPSPYEYRFIKKNGDVIWVMERVTSTYYQGKRATIGSFMDVTVRKQAEEELKHGIKELQLTLDATINAMAVIVETKDPYTAGHQRRVTHLACAIAKEQGLPKTQIDGIRMASAIHDIGKICVPTEILSKPGKLEDIEFNLIKNHPMVGFTILKEMKFGCPVAQTVLQHHERMDGSGYPMGLKEDEILVEARILAVADVVEAMASYRPYRPALGIDLALSEIMQNKGALYDPNVVDTCISLFRDKGFSLV
jgi:PAS domain S-box-containing protein